MDMDPHTPKAIWGFNGTERPGAVYLAAVLAAHAQKGLPAFGIYGHDVQDADATEIPADVQEKILRFARAGLAVATMRGKSYLSMGNVAMGIAGSIVNPDFFEKFLGMRCEQVDMSEFVRRWDENIYDHEEFDQGMRLGEGKRARIGWDKNPRDPCSTPRSSKQWALETCIKMTMIARDLMIGNPQAWRRWASWRKAAGTTPSRRASRASASGRTTSPMATMMESLLNSSFDWNGIREPFVVATENDALNGVCMLLGHLLTGSASAFADVRTYWSPEAVERVTGWKPDGLAEGRLYPPDQFRRGGAGRQRRVRESTASPP